jgi:hypothetical protein
VLSPTTRLLLRLSALLYLGLGLVLFLFPQWASGEFPWKVTPFLAMTIGGWALGTAVFASEAARIGRLAIVFPLVIYLGVFAVLELLVLVAFASVFRVSATLTVPYVLTLAVGALAGLSAVVDWRRGASLDDPGAPPLSRVAKIADAVFVIFVLGLWLGGAISGQGGTATEGRIFAEPLSLFSVRAFAAFYFALDIAVLALLWKGRMRAEIAISRAGLALLGPIVLAAILNLGLFDFAARPGGLLYFAAYLVAGVLIVIILTRIQGWRIDTREASR